MVRALVILLAAGAGLLSACTPTFNWREVRVEAAGLQAMLPCKPESASRAVALAGRAVNLEVRGCDTGGATFALMYADMADPAIVGQALAQWKRGSLANMRSSRSQEQAFQPPGALGLPDSVRVSADGLRVDGSPVQGQAAYFARGRFVIQASIFADRIRPEVSETFFAGLRFQ